jgi:chromatin modification-related protein VID21
MRTDFREERRWKLAVAFNLAHTVKAWHSATLDERTSLCVLDRCYSPVDAEASPMEVEMRLGLDIAEEAECARGAQRFTIDLPSVEPEVSWQDSQELDPEREAEIIRAQQRAERKDTPIDERNYSVGKEEDPDAEGEADADGEMDVDDADGVADTKIGEGLHLDDDGMQSLVPLAGVQTEQAPPNDSFHANEGGLKTGSSDPSLTFDPDKLLGPVAQTSTPAESMKSQLRETLAYIPDDATFFDVERLCSDLSHLSTVDPFVPLQLPEIFPDLPTFQPLFASPGQAESIVVPKGDKKSEKKDKKVVEELTRVDEMVGLKVVSVSTFMQYKPTLVSALQPAKRWRHDAWVDLDDTVVAGDDTPLMLEPLANGKTYNYIFVMGDLDPLIGLFGQPKHRAPSISPFNSADQMPKDPQKRFNETSWSASEDQILKNLADRYSGNWSLIADIFNSSRVTISTDKRTAWDCFARWDARWNEGRILMASTTPVTPGSVADSGMEPVVFPAALTSASGPATPAAVHPMLNAVTTRKRSASQLNLFMAGPQAESRKRRRHNHMHEAMRESAKKRETNVKQIGALNSLFGMR